MDVSQKGILPGSHDRASAKPRSKGDQRTVPELIKEREKSSNIKFADFELHELFHFEISPVELEEAILDENKRRRIAKSLQLSAERLPEASQEDYEDIDVGQELEAPKLIKTPIAPTQKEREEHEATGHAV